MKKFLCLGLSIGCDLITIRILSDSREHLQYLDPLETSFPLGEIKTKQIYKDYDIRTVQRGIIGEQTKHWVEKILVNSGFGESEALLVVAIPALLEKEVEIELCKSLNQIKGITIGRIYSRSNIAPLSVSAIHELACLSVFSDSIGIELLRHDNNDGVYENLRSFYVAQSNEVERQPDTFLEIIQTELNRNLSADENSLMHSRSIDKVLVFSNTPEQKLFIDKICLLFSISKTNMVIMDKGSIAAACCISAGILTGKVRDILHLESFSYNIFGREIGDNFISKPVKLIEKDTPIPLKTIVALPELMPDSSIELYTAHDHEGEYQFWKIDTLKARDLSFPLEKNMQASIEIDINSNNDIKSSIVKTPI